MSHKTAYLLVDFAGKTSVCGVTAKRGVPIRTPDLPHPKLLPRQRHPASAGLRQ